MRMELLHLPLEIQRKIYYHAVESWDLEIAWRTTDGEEIQFPEHSAPAGVMHISASPCFAWLTVCTIFERELRPLIQSAFSGIMHLPQGQMIDYYPRKFTALMKDWGKRITQVKDAFSYTQSRPLYLQRNCIDWNLLPNLKLVDFCESKCVRKCDGSSIVGYLRGFIGNLDLYEILNRRCDGQLWSQAGYFLDLLDLRILYRIMGDTRVQWTIDIDMRDTFPGSFLTLQEISGDILRIHFQAPWSFVTSQYPYNSHSNFETKTGSQLNEPPLDLHLTISIAYSAWYKEACGSPNPNYFLGTAVSPLSGLTVLAEHHEMKWTKLNARDISKDSIEVHEDPSWPETFWMSNGELSSERPTWQ